MHGNIYWFSYGTESIFVSESIKELFWKISQRVFLDSFEVPAVIFLPNLVIVIIFDSLKSIESICDSLIVDEVS